jgi:hypothetical protein
VRAATAGGWRAALPWIIAGAALGAMLATFALRSAGSGDAAPAATPLADRITRAPDISTMTPQERANRLFDRVMRHAEANQPDSVQFFLPMALQAHAMLLGLDADGRFHVGLLHLAGGNAAAALAQADTLRREAATHLFAPMLRARALATQRDDQGARRAYREFLRNEASERALGRPEYADHVTTLDMFHEEALRAAEQ